MINKLLKRMNQKKKPNEEQDFYIKMVKSNLLSRQRKIDLLAS
jgi:hypothetical protein